MFRRHLLDWKTFLQLQLLYWNYILYFLLSDQGPPAKPESQTADPYCPLQDKQEQLQLPPVEIPHYRTHDISAASSVSSAEPQSATLDKQNPASPKIKLTLSSSEKEKLLNWDLTTPGKFSEDAPATDETIKDNQSSPENQTEPENDPDQSPPLLGFQLWASVLRRSFSNSNNPKVIRRNRPPRARPLSEGSFSLGQLFRASTHINEEDAERSRSRAVRGGGQHGSKGRSEITTMLEQVTLCTKTPGGSKDDMASLPPRKLNFFSSLRLKRNEGVDRGRVDNQTKDIWTILSKFRNKSKKTFWEGIPYFHLVITT